MQLYVGGVIASAEGPGASAMLVDGAAIEWIGTDAQVAGLRHQIATVVHLGGALVLPAFVDAHVHLSQTGLAMRGVDLTATHDLAEALDLIAVAALHAPAGRGLFAPNWQERQWPEGRAPTAAELDRAAPGRLVYAPRIDLHSAAVSSALAQVSGAARETGWLGDGLVERDAHHAARTAFAAMITPDERRADIERALRAAAAEGIATVHECAGPVVSSEEDLVDVLACGRRPDLPATVGYWAQRVTTPLEATTLRDRIGAHGLGGDLFIDGSLGSRTAHLTTPYADLAGEVGSSYLSLEDAAAHIAACCGAGIQSGFHAIGDAGIHTVLDALDLAAARLGLPAVPAGLVRLEHVEMIDSVGVARMARHRAAASVQPMFDALWGGPDGMYAERLGAGRVQGMNPFRSMWSQGVTLAFGSDSPVTPFGPWSAIRAATDHRDPGQRVPMHVALDAHTAGGHRAAGDQGGGVLRPGAAATFAAWDGIALGPNGIPRLDEEWPSCRLTVRDGVVLYAR